MVILFACFAETRGNSWHTLHRSWENWHPLTPKPMWLREEVSDSERIMPCNLFITASGVESYQMRRTCKSWSKTNKPGRKKSTDHWINQKQTPQTYPVKWICWWISKPVTELFKWNHELIIEREYCISVIIVNWN